MMHCNGFQWNVIKFRRKETITKSWTFANIWWSYNFWRCRWNFRSASHSPPHDPPAPLQLPTAILTSPVQGEVLVRLHLNSNLFRLLCTLEHFEYVLQHGSAVRDVSFCSEALTWTKAIISKGNESKFFWPYMYLPLLEAFSEEWGGPPHLNSFKARKCIC